MPVDWAALVGRDAREVQAVLLEELDALRADLTAEQEDALVRALPEPLRAVHLVSTLEVEVSLGSLLGYLGNSAGRHAPLAVDVLHRMGAVRTADVLAQALAVRAAAEGEWAARRAELADVEPFAVVRPYDGLSDADQLSELTDALDEATEADDLYRRLDDYVAAQVQVLAAQASGGPQAGLDSPIGP